MAKNEDAGNGNIRHRFSVPVADTLVEEWIAAQSNLGFSLRVLINTFVNQFGMQDATCVGLGMTVSKKGRPPKDVQARIQSMFVDSSEPEGVRENDRKAGYHDEPNRGQASFQAAVSAPQEDRRPDSFARNPVPAVQGDIMNMLGSGNNAARQLVQDLDEGSDGGDFLDPEDVF